MNSKTSKHPPQDPMFLDRKMQKTRALVTGFYFMIGCVAFGSGAVRGNADKVLVAIALMPLSSVLLLWKMKRSSWNPPLITAASLAADTLLASWVIYWTGGVLSPCLPFYLTSVMAASFRFGPPGSVFYTVLSVAGFCAAGSLPPLRYGLPENTASMILRIAILFSAAAFGIGVLHRKLERYRKERDLRKELEKANQDLTLAYRNLHSTQDQLFHADKLASIGRLVAGVAHEINNPISFVYGNLIHIRTYVQRMKSLLAFYEGLSVSREVAEQRESLKRTVDYDYLWKDLDRALDDSCNGAERIRKIVEALLKFSRTRKGTFRGVTLEDPVENALCILGGKLKKGIRLVREYDRRACVHGDPDELTQLFLNLLSNAVDAVGKEGTVLLRSGSPEKAETPDRIVIEIQDTGPGIPPENRSRIFEPFFTTKEVGKGTGLGLSIAYSIVKRHKGDIAALGDPGNGALFRVRLPTSSQ